MSKIRFFWCTYASLTALLLTVWISGKYSIWGGIVLGLITIVSFSYSCISRGKITNQPKTARCAIGFFALGPILVAIGFLAKHSFHAPTIIPNVVAGAGIWSLGIALYAVAALWNGSWYVTGRG